MNGYPLEIANAGAGSLSDLAKMTARDGGTLLLTDTRIAAYGAGFVSDPLKFTTSPSSPLLLVMDTSSYNRRITPLVARR